MMENMKTIYGTLALVLFAAALLVACSPEHYRREADRQVYGIVAQKQQQVLGATREFNIDPLEVDLLESLPVEVAELTSAGTWEIIGAPDTVAPGALQSPTREKVMVLPLDDALGISVLSGREYLRRKEDVYLTALSLTSVLHNFENNYLWTGGVDVTGDADGPETLSGDTRAGFSRALATGGSLVLNLSGNFLRYLSGNFADSSDSLVSLSFLQPLLRGAGQRIALEGLTQAERDSLYQVRSFERFRRTFAVDLADDYFRVLQQQDRVVNEYQNYEGLTYSLIRSACLAEAGTLPPFQVDQVQQDQLRARNRWIVAREQYELQLDQFKIRLGLPADAPIILDQSELERLVQVGLVEVPFPPDEAVETALANRLDLANTRDQVEDASRQVEVARNNLKADLDFAASANLPSDPNQPLDFRTDEARGSIGLSGGLPLDRLDERNAYRRSLISLQRQRRQLEEEVDSVKLDVRSAYRSLIQLRESFLIQQDSLEVARRRVDEVDLRLQAGRANTRDLLEAQESLLNARNALTAALVDYTIARLNLYADVGALEINEEGMWTE